MKRTWCVHRFDVSLLRESAKSRKPRNPRPQPKRTNNPHFISCSIHPETVITHSFRTALSINTNGEELLKIEEDRITADDHSRDGSKCAPESPRSHSPESAMNDRISLTVTANATESGSRRELRTLMGTGLEVGRVITMAIRLFIISRSWMGISQRVVHHMVQGLEVLQRS
jgi:hypothetical protein